MAANKKLNGGSADLLTANSKAVEQAIKKAARSALLKHKQANNPVAVWREGKVILIEANELLPDKEQT